MGASSCSIQNFRVFTGPEKQNPRSGSRPGVENSLVGVPLIWAPFGIRRASGYTNTQNKSCGLQQRRPNQQTQPHVQPGIERRSAIGSVKVMATCCISVVVRRAYCSRASGFNENYQLSYCNQVAEGPKAFVWIAAYTHVFNGGLIEHGGRVLQQVKAARMYYSDAASACDSGALGMLPIFMPNSTATLCASPRRPFLRPEST